MKVLFLLRKLAAGGVERQVVECATGLYERGCNVVVVTFYSGGIFADVLAARGIRVYTLRKLGRWDLVRFFLRLGGALSAERPDVVYSHLSVPNVVALLFKSFVPSYRVVWSISGSDFSLFRDDWLETVVCLIERSFSSLPDLIVSNAHAGRRGAIQAGFPSSRTIVIPNGVDTVTFRINRAAGREFRHEHGIGDHEVLVGCVGRFHRDKDHETFLKMAVRLSSQQDMKFICIGEGPADYTEMLVELAVDLGVSDRLIWCPTQVAMTQVYNALDLLCLTSQSEGLPNVLCEAASCGVPCVATDVGDVSLFMGSLGYVAPAGDVEALARACEATLRRLQKEGDTYRHQWREHVLRRYRRDRMVRKVHAAFGDLVSDRSFVRGTPNSAR